MDGMSDIRNEIEQRLGVFARPGAKDTFADATVFASFLRLLDYAGTAIAKNDHVAAQNWYSQATKMITAHPDLNRAGSSTRNRWLDIGERIKKARQHSRPGAKAAFGADQIPFWLDALASQVVDQKDVAKKNAQAIADYVFKHGTEAQIKRFVQLADRVGLRVNMSRPGAKAAFAITKAQIRSASREELRSIEQRLTALAKSGDKNAAALLDYVEQEYNDRYRGTHSRPGAKATAAKADDKTECADCETEQDKAGLKLMEKADKAVSDKIRTLIKEGKPQDQAVAIALDMKRRGEL